MKNIFICTDGTWNTTLQTDRGKLSPTNVAKMARLIRTTPKQCIYYDRGVGTDNIIDKLRGGVFGAGLYENVKQAYKFIVANYKQGDKINLIGFSRGAFTARCLGGMITKVGILRNKYIRDIDSIYSLYKSDTTNSDVVKEYCEHFCHSNRQIQFIGVWDTVGALGIPSSIFNWFNIRKYGFLNTDLSPNIENAYHALAIDEHRRPFKPTLWNEDKVHKGQILEQKWFVGAHSNVGGGYADDGLSNITLEWMIERLVKTIPKVALNDSYIKNIIPDYKGELRNEVSWSYPVSLIYPYDRPVFDPKYASIAIDQSVYSRANDKSINYDYLDSNIK